MHEAVQPSDCIGGFPYDTSFSFSRAIFGQGTYMPRPRGARVLEAPRNSLVSFSGGNLFHFILSFLSRSFAGIRCSTNFFFLPNGVARHPPAHIPPHVPGPIHNAPKKQVPSRWPQTQQQHHHPGAEQNRGGAPPPLLGRFCIACKSHWNPFLHKHWVNEMACLAYLESLLACLCVIATSRINGCTSVQISSMIPSFFPS